MPDVTDKSVAVTSRAPRPAELVFFTVPEFDALGEGHPGIRMNGVFYGPGTHAVTADQAVEANRILNSYNHYSVRILQPHRDLKTLRQVTNRGGTNTDGSENHG